MTGFSLFHKHPLLFWAIVISIFYNLLWMAVYILLLNYFPLNVSAMTMIFLASYIFIALPIKDLIVKLVYTRKHYAAEWQSAIINKTVPDINSFEQIGGFLKKVVRNWKLRSIKFVQYIPEQKMLIINQSGHERWIHFRRPENDEFYISMKNFPWARNITEYPPMIRDYLESKNVRCVVPIVYREAILGFVGFPVELDPLAMNVAESLSRKIGLLMENHILRAKIPRSHLIRQEFSTAKRIENYLATDREFRTTHYRIQPIRSGWEQKFFPALFESSARGQGSAPEAKEYFILVRLPHSSHRSSAIQLFSAQGYFLTLSRKAPNLRELARLMQEALLHAENSGFMLEGFLMEVEGLRWNILSFGESLSLWVNEKEIPLKRNSPLGNLNFRTTKQIQINKPVRILFSLKGIPLVRVDEIQRKGSAA